MSFFLVDHKTYYYYFPPLCISPQKMILGGDIFSSFDIEKAPSIIIIIAEMSFSKYDTFLVGVAVRKLTII